MYFDEKLKSLRLKRGLSLAGLADKLDIKKDVLDSLETGFCDPSDKDLDKITGFFGVTREELADDQPAANAFSVLFGQSSFAMDGQLPSIDLPLSESRVLAKIPLSSSAENIWLPVLAVPGQEYEAVKVPDDHLSSIGVFKGDIAVVCVNKSVPAGKIAALSQDGQIIFRKDADIKQAYGYVTEIRKLL